MLSRKIFVSVSGIECVNSALRFSKGTYDEVVNIFSLMEIFLINKFYIKSVIYSYSILIFIFTAIN